METRLAYNIWSQQYDTNNNKTRDLEAQALRSTLCNLHFDNCLEIGCGTGKNTVWLVTKAKHLTAIDLSEEMLAQAKAKVTSPDIRFILADITSSWVFAANQFDLVTCSLVLEHIQNLDHIFCEISRSIVTGGYVYIGELHPFKQYGGTKARFETEAGLHIVDCYNHNISEFTQAAKKYHFNIIDVNEFFDDADNTTIPRILTLVLQKV